jgi:excisionase family DNA binding protein
MATDAAMERRTFTPAEAALVLGLSEQAVRDNCRSGRIRGIKFGGQWRITRAALEEALGEPLTPVAVESGWSPEDVAKLREARRLLVEITSRQERLNALLGEIEGE